MISNYFELKQEAFLANLEIPKRGLAIYTWGNVSAFDKNKGVFAIKPSGVEYDELSVDDIVVVDLEGKIVEGSKVPSSDTQTHLILYKNFPNIGGITHTHSPYATAWAQSCKSIPIQGTTHADHTPYPIACTPYLDRESVVDDYERNTGILIVDTFKNKLKAMPLLGGENYPSNELDPLENPMVLVSGHGPFCWGENAHKSVYNASVLEEIAKIAFFMVPLQDSVNTLPSYIIDKHYYRKHGKNSYYGQN